ncbi:MFS general substrate transporter [Corynespora cassiicola Philippines]|uniref:MFS general substrate transporter n=1 Tax=Corynespora cassiicola Philippines TaxID=1448308 RepID=A0A2T2NWT5_CORCC|nr:MFS general substrate transporter [Corynespora cassiicola Philippines]
MDTIRDAPFGQLLRYLTGNRVFLYPEEKPGYQFPSSYLGKDEEIPEKRRQKQAPIEKETKPPPQQDESRIEPVEAPEVAERDVEKAESSSSDDENATNFRRVASHASSLHRVATLPYTAERLAADQALALEKTQSKPITPEKTANGTIIVDWWATDDPENPQNWSWKKKATTALIIDVYTLVVYASSAIYVSSQELVMQRFGVGHTKGALGLALYVLGYGMGPLIFAPLSEVPYFGRNIPYIVTFGLFTILALPTALVDNMGGLLVLRYLQGFFGSPCLANGGASMGDMYSLLYLPYPVAAWVSFAFAAPAIGPLLSGFAVYAENWRWALWEILWMAGPVFLVFFFFVPETQPTTILLNRAKRLRRITGNQKIRSQTEINERGVNLGATVLDAIIKPLEITIKDPAILFVNVYTALTYGIYYSFFEVFPLVYPPLYGFNVGETGIVFLCIIVGCFIAMAIYFSYLHFFLIPDVLKNGLRTQEYRLRPSLIACLGPTVGLFLFGWTARSSIHWIVSVIGVTIYATTVYIVMQCIFTYVPMSYPQYAASLFAGNDFFRSLFAFGAILFGRPMYVNLGVGEGISLLGGLSVIGIVGMWLLYFYGANLRARSKFAI